MMWRILLIGTPPPLMIAINAATDGTQDPASLFTQLGAFAAAAVALFAWQRDTARQRDRLMEAVEHQGPILIEMRDALRNTSDTLRAASEAMIAMAKSLERIPSETEIVRLRDALTRADNPRQRDL